MCSASLRPAGGGETMPDAPSYAESLYAELELGWAPLHAWRTAEVKFIRAPRSELYLLGDDASETRNRIGEHPARARELGGALKAAQWIAGKRGVFEFSEVLFGR